MRRIILFSLIQQLLYYVSRVESLIGENTTPIRYGEFPFVASFQYFPGEQNFCGGALITKKHVITSVYCLRDTAPGRFRIAFEVAHEQGPILTYTAASWTAYNNWAERQGIQYDAYNVVYNLAIVTLTDKVYNIRPVPLNGLNKSQLAGTEAKMIGRRNDVLSKATVNVLSDKDCESKMRQFRFNVSIFDEKVLYSNANPYALSDVADIGSPLLHAHDNSLLGVAFSCSPGVRHFRGNFSNEFIRQHQVNVHLYLNYYRLFFHSVIPATPGA